MNSYRIHVRITGAGALESVRMFSKKSDEEAVAEFNKLKEKADEDAAAGGRIVTRPEKLVRIDVKEVTTDLTPYDDIPGDNLEP
jgi:hypothetical protein